VAEVSSRRIVLSAPLCYAAAKYGSIAPKDLRTVLAGFYNSEQLAEASRLLQAEIVRLQPDFSRKLANRRNSQNQPEARLRLEADDLISLVTYADEAALFSSLPIFASADPDLIPSRQLLEGGFKAIMRQFETMSEQYNEIKSSLQHMSTTSSYATVFPPLVGGGPEHVLNEPVSWTSRTAPATDSETEAQMDVVLNRRNEKKRRLESGSPPATCPAPAALRTYSSAAASAPKHPQPARRPVLVGNSTTSTLKASKHLDFQKKVFRIGNIDAIYDDVAISAHLKSIGVTCFTCFERTSVHSLLMQNKAFRVCILAADSDKLQSPEHWSAGISISEWEFRPRDPEPEGEKGASPKGRRGPAVAPRAVVADIERLVDEVRSGMEEGSGTDNGGH
jgi:hypothetical protein